MVNIQRLNLFIVPLVKLWSDKCPCCVGGVFVLAVACRWLKCEIMGCVSDVLS